MKKKSILWLMLCYMMAFIGHSQQLSDNNSELINAYFKPHITTAITSETNLFQQGNYNEITIQTDAKSQIQVGQMGNYNGYFFISAYGNNDFSIDVLQQGDRNTIQVFGENNLMKNAVIRQTGSDRQIIITNN